jgi:malic enzyme
MIASAPSILWSGAEQILRDPLRNKDAAFTLAERAQFGLTGLLPSAVLTIEQQVAMELEHLFSKSDPLEQYIGLIALLERNETLFYRVLIENLERLTPIIYTPTVGLACEHYSHIFRRPRGLFLCPNDRGQIAERLAHFGNRNIRLIVVTDNERILGLGDQGAGGMAIPIGKLVLYSAAAGIHPSLCLPVSLDMGTDNSALLEDPLYLGYRSRRLRGDAYSSFVDEFVQAVKTVFPRALLQWEDFKKANAFRLMERYVTELPSFNDDIQGTAAVTLAGILCALRITGEPLYNQRVLVAGAGAAGIGIGRLLRAALMDEGLTREQALQRMLFIDSGGVVHENRADLEAHKREFALSRERHDALGPSATSDTSPLEQIVSIFHPTILIGTTGQPGDFTAAGIRAMARHCGRPIIFPLSNPTSKAECTPSEAIQNSGGRALVATGSPFEPVHYQGRKHVIGQCNNVFIFPGVGLAALISDAKRVTESMFLAAARALAAFTGAKASAEETLYPRLCDLREATESVALAAARTAREEGFGKNLNDAELKAAIACSCWFPNYPTIPTAPARAPANPPC